MTDDSEFSDEAYEATESGELHEIDDSDLESEHNTRDEPVIEEEASVEVQIDELFREAVVLLEGTNGRQGIFPNFLAMGTEVEEIVDLSEVVDFIKSNQDLIPSF